MIEDPLASILLAVDAHNAAVYAAAAGARSDSSAPELEAIDSDRIPYGSTYILIVEDDPDIREVVRSALTDAGYEVHTATDGEKALTFLNDEYMASQQYGLEPRVPSVILLDLAMPVMSGWDFFVALRNRPAFAHTPVIVMSADYRIRNFAHAVDVNDLDPPAGSLPKPFALEGLLQKVADAIARSLP